MNRYMITREKIKGQEYLISALYDEKKHMIEVLPEAAGETSLLGNIYVGKVENIVTNLNAAFVKIAPDVRCYLPLSDVKNPVFTRKLMKDSVYPGLRHSEYRSRARRLRQKIPR